MARNDARNQRKSSSVTEKPDELRAELVAHFRKKRNDLRKLWVEQMTGKGLLAGLTQKEIDKESATIYDTCVSCLETGRFAAAEEYAQNMAERGVLRGMTTEQIIGGMLTLRDVYGRSLAEVYRSDMKRLGEALDVYEPVANNILSIVALAFIQEREKVVSSQQEAIRELSTPVLQIRDKLLILPVIGLIDTLRARQLTEQLLEAIRDRRAKVVVVDITGVPNVDSKVANHLIQTAEASKILGAKCIFTGVSPEIAQTIVSIGVEVSKMYTVGDLQGGIEEAERMLAAE